VDDSATPGDSASTPDDPTAETWFPAFRRPTTVRSLPSAFLVGHLEIARILELQLEVTGLSALEAIVTRTILLNRNASLGDVRERLALPASTATHVLDRLCGRGYARRATAFDDRRVAMVSLTGPGKEVGRMVDEAILALDRQILTTAGVSGDEVTRVVDAIESLAIQERRLRIRRS
jgi:DNA-binding MarR family transcriptional regulator